MIEVLKWVLLILAVVLLPPLLIGVIRKTKARLQNRIGAPYHQPLLDLIKLLKKGELLSDSSSWMLRGAAVANPAVAVLLALTVPWIPGIPALFHLDIFLFVYLFVLLRFITVLSALDTGSAFGGFAASREVTLSVLVEPGVMLCLSSLAVVAQSSDLQRIFSFQPGDLSGNPTLWATVGCGMFLASLVEMSRMPADDPTTHLELTMVHEAMILENSGPNLALTDYTTGLKLMVLMGISAQCLIHTNMRVWSAPALGQFGLGAVSLVAMFFLIALIESSAVKLRWTRLPQFIAYGVTFGLLSIFAALGALV